MEYSSHFFTAKDGFPIHYYYWQNLADKNLGVVQFAHGIGEHAKRYERIANILQKIGFEVYANDHRCHGLSVKIDQNLGVYEGANFFKDAVKDMRQLTKIIKKNHPKQKIILLGHSMGSLLSRDYVTKYGKDIELLLLSGTASFMKGLGNIGLISTKIIKTFAGRQKSNKLLKDVFFSEFNKSVKNHRTKVDWISRDEQEVDKFDADPLRVENFSLSIIEDLITGSKKVNSIKYFEKTPNNLPIYIFSGDKDPVGEMGKGVEKVYHQYKIHGNTDVTLKLYKGGRHEMLNEINKEEVEQDLVNWLATKLNVKF